MFIEGLPEENAFDQFCADELYFYDDEDDRTIEDWQVELADGIFNILHGLLVSNDLDEEFTSPQSATLHFDKHCIRNTGRRSTRTNVYYDFTSLQDYLKYEDSISAKTQLKNSRTLFVQDLVDGAAIVKKFRKLSEGNAVLIFGLGCGFTNSLGQVRICISAFSKAVDNYKNTALDFLVQAPDGKTISLYPIDANYLETALNNKIAKITNAKALTINH